MISPTHIEKTLNDFYKDFREKSDAYKEAIERLGVSERLNEIEWTFDNYSQGYWELWQEYCGILNRLKAEVRFGRMKKKK